MSTSSKEMLSIIYTIGHSNRSEAEFLTLLREFQIQLLVDIRRFPGSAKWPQFSQAHLQHALQEHGIQYVHLEALGGRRSIHKDSANVAWRNASFRAYADYMETPAFAAGIEELERLARQHTTVIMCAEAVWWRCHRSLVSDYLKNAGWQVYHIMGRAKATAHPYTAAAKIVNGHLSYR